MAVGHQISIPSETKGFMSEQLKDYSKRITNKLGNQIEKHILEIDKTN